MSSDESDFKPPRKKVRRLEDTISTSSGCPVIGGHFANTVGSIDKNSYSLENSSESDSSVVSSKRLEKVKVGYDLTNYSTRFDNQVFLLNDIV